MQTCAQISQFIQFLFLETNSKLMSAQGQRKKYDYLWWCLEG